MSTLAKLLLPWLSLSFALLGCSSSGSQSTQQQGVSEQAKAVDPPPPDILPYNVEIKPSANADYLPVDISIVHVNQEFQDATINSLTLKLLVEDKGSYVDYSDPLDISGADLSTLKSALEPGHPLQHHVIHAKFKLKLTKLWDKHVVLDWACNYEPRISSGTPVPRRIGIYDPTLSN